MKRSFPAARRSIIAALGAVLLSGCATQYPNPDDPLEGYNRAMFGFNEGVDKAIIKPVAEGYDVVAPLPVKTGVGNFFGNIADVWTALNGLLQGKFEEAASDVARILVNTTVGIGGVFDIATEMGLEKHDEDLGQTLGKWGVGEGPYFVTPFFGPRTLRDAAVLPIDLVGTSVWGVGDPGARNALRALRITHVRSTLLGVEKTLSEGTLDKYSYVRDFYLQQRRYKVFDGRPPKDRLEDELGAAAGPAAQLDATVQASLESLELVELAAVAVAAHPQELGDSRP